MKIETMMITIALLVVGCATEQPAKRTEPSASPPPTGPMVTPEQNDAIDALFRRKTPQLMHCWQEEYERTQNRKLEGDITVTMMIASNGKPGDLRVVNSTMGVPTVDTCVISEIGSWTFPEGPGNAPYRRTVHLGAEY